jgi:hypothetical protein
MLTLILAASLLAQPAAVDEIVRAGDEVKIELITGGVLEGRVTSVIEDQIAVSDWRRERRFARPDILSIRRKDGSRSDGFLKGAAIGVAGGMLLGLIRYGSVCGWNKCDGSGWHLYGAIYAVPFGLVSGVAGAAVTSVRWTPVMLPAPQSAQGRAPSLGASFRF